MEPSTVRPTREPMEVTTPKPFVGPSSSPSGTSEPDERPLKEKLDILDTLLKTVIHGVNIDEHGFVPHGKFEAPRLHLTVILKASLQPTCFARICYCLQFIF